MNTNNLLRQLVSIPSFYPEEKNIVNFLSSFFRQAHYTVIKQRVAAKRYNVIVKKGQGKKGILLYGHLDTVSVASGWKTDPYTLTIFGDRAYGLGAWDMKGGMASTIITFLEYQPKNIVLKLALCVDEENISQGGHVLIDSEVMNSVSCVISPEPAFFYGSQGIVTGRSGRCVYMVEIKGKSRHFAQYKRSYDINAYAGDILSKLKSCAVTKGDQKQFIFARGIHSQASGLSIPEETVLELDACVLPPQTNASIMGQIKKIIDGSNRKNFDSHFTVSVTYKKRVTPFLNPYKIKENDVYLKCMKKVIHRVTGNQAVPYFRSSVADENIFGSHGISVLGIGPIGENAHAPNEWISLQSLDTYHNILHEFLTSVDNET